MINVMFSDVRLYKHVYKHRNSLENVHKNENIIHFYFQPESNLRSPKKTNRQDRLKTAHASSGKIQTNKLLNWKNLYAQQD